MFRLKITAHTTPKTYQSCKMANLYVLEGKTVYPIEDNVAWSYAQEHTPRIVKQTELPTGKFVSTVFTGINAPLFETVVFPRKGDWTVLGSSGYDTYLKAELGHEDMVRFHQ